MATNLTKQQLFQNRLDNIYTNGNNEVSANMTGNFCDNFIESIYTYTDLKLGDFVVTNGKEIGIPGESKLDFNEDILNFSSTSAKIRVGNINRIQINPSTSTTGINLDNIIVFGGSKIGVPGESHLDFLDGELIFESNSKIKTSSLLPVNLDIENENTQIRLMDEDINFKGAEHIFFNSSDNLARLNINFGGVNVPNGNVGITQNLNVGGNIESSTGFIVQGDVGITKSFVFVDREDNQHTVDIKGGLIITWDIV